MTFLPMENIQLPCFNVDPVTGPNYGFNSSNPSQEVITDPTDLPGHQRKKQQQHNISDKEHKYKILNIWKSSVSAKFGWAFPILTQAGCDTVSSVRAGQRWPGQDLDHPV